MTTFQVGAAAPNPSSFGCCQAKEIARHSQEIAFYMPLGLLSKCKRAESLAPGFNPRSGPLCFVLLPLGKFTFRLFSSPSKDVSGTSVLDMGEFS